MMRPVNAAISMVAAAALTACVPGAISLGASELAFAESVAGAGTEACVKGGLNPPAVVPALASAGFVDDGNSFGPTILIARSPGGRLQFSVLASEPCRFQTEYSASAAVERGAEAALSGMGFARVSADGVWSSGESRVRVTIRTHSSYTNGSSGTQLLVERA